MSIARILGGKAERRNKARELGAGKTGKRFDGWALGNEPARGHLSRRSKESELSPYVAIHVTTTPSNSSHCLDLSEMNGGRGRTRTCDLLRVKQARFPNTIIIEQIFLQETSS
jgi:hypothetical protein